MTNWEGLTVRLRVPVLTRWRPAIPVVLVGILGLAGGLTGVSEVLAKSTSITTFGKVVFVVLGVVALALGGWLLRYGARMGRQASARTPQLEATPETIRLIRANRKPREVPRGKVAAASFELHPDDGEAGLSYLEWFDEGRRSLGVWTLDPVVRRPLPRWLDDIHVELAAAPTPRTVRPED